MMIFISYRREDSAPTTGRIDDRLVDVFGRRNVYKDVDAIPFGVDFSEHIKAAVGRCDVLLAVIGKNWLDARSEDGNRRIDDPTDWVRLEIESALHRDIPVIPLLLDGISMVRPKDLPESIQKLAYRNAVPIRWDPDFHRDIDRLIDGLRTFKKPHPKPVRREGPARKTPGRGIAVFASILIATGLLGYGIWGHGSAEVRVDEVGPSPVKVASKDTVQADGMSTGSAVPKKVVDDQRTPPRAASDGMSTGSGVAKKGEISQSPFVATSGPSDGGDISAPSSGSTAILRPQSIPPMPIPPAPSGLSPSSEGPAAPPSPSKSTAYFFSLLNRMAKTTAGDKNDSIRVGLWVPSKVRDDDLVMFEDLARAMADANVKLDSVVLPRSIEAVPAIPGVSYAEDLGKILDNKSIDTIVIYGISRKDAEFPDAFLRQAESVAQRAHLALIWASQAGKDSFLMLSAEDQKGWNPGRLKEGELLQDYDAVSAERKYGRVIWVSNFKTGNDFAGFFKSVKSRDSGPGDISNVIK